MKEYMKKIIFFMLIFMCYSTINAATFDVAVVSSSKEAQSLGSYDQYNEAKDKMNAYPSDEKNVAVIYKDGKIINAKYAVAQFNYDKSQPNSGGASNIHRLFANTWTSTVYTTVSAAYGIDSAFLDYDIESDRALIKLSGYQGWTYVSNINIVPISSLSSNVKITATTNINVRSDHHTGASILGSVGNGNIYPYYDIFKDANYTWYKIYYNGTYAWIAAENERWAVPIDLSLETYYEAYETGNLIHYYNSHWGQLYTNLGPYPSFLRRNKNYYSFDGNYFYENYLSMIDDYKENTHHRAVNKDQPHYAYYLYLTNHTKTGYTADDFNQIIRNYGYQSKDDSAMYNEGNSFIESQEKYGVNALLTFSAALNESAKGTSDLAKYKNNLFGHGAIDSCPFECATAYESAKDSIFAHARMTGSGYNDPADWRYYGAHYGNKQSGMNIQYATDPYWGEKAAGNAFINDNNFGRQDYLSNTIGIKVSSKDVPIKKMANHNSPTIYTLKNKSTSVENVPVIVTDKISMNGENWYKVYTDVALNENQDISDVDYDFKLSYGFIPEKDLYVANHQPQINAQDLEISINENVDLMKNVTAYDTEDGDLTSRITYQTNLNTNVPGVYNVSYTVEDDSRFSVTKIITVKVEGHTIPEIDATDKTIIQYREFNNLEGVTAKDAKDGDLTQSIIIKENTVDINIPGEYKIVYMVTNSMGITTEKAIKVTVLVNAKPEIYVTNKSILLNCTFDPMEGVSAKDVEDGDLTKDVKVIQNDVDTSKEGTYKVTYEVTDKDHQTTTKTVTYTVTKKELIEKTGEFYLHELSWDKQKKKYTISGYLIALGMNNKANETTYELILKDKESNQKYSLEIDSWTKNVPYDLGSENGFSYTDSWFKGTLDFSDIPAGDYDLYMKAVKGEYFTETEVTNIMNQPIDRRAEDEKHGYNFKVMLSLKSKKIQLSIRDELITTSTANTFRNMVNDYDNIVINEQIMNLKGTSYNYGGTYQDDKKITRKLILENTKTFKQYRFDIGSTKNGSYLVVSSDNKDKTYAWFDAKVDLSKLEKGTYSMIVYTKTTDSEDYGEIIDIFGAINPAEGKYKDKTYQLSLNKKRMNRLELIVK